MPLALAALTRFKNQKQSTRVEQVSARTIEASNMSDDKKIDDETTPAGEGEEDEEDLEKLQAEIARMEAEAARITKETEELEKKKEAKLASVATGGESKASAGEGTSRDG